MPQDDCRGIFMSLGAWFPLVLPSATSLPAPLICQTVAGTRCEAAANWGCGAADTGGETPAKPNWAGARKPYESQSTTGPGPQGEGAWYFAHRHVASRIT